MRDMLRAPGFARLGLVVTVLAWCGKVTSGANEPSGHPLLARYPVNPRT